MLRTPVPQRRIPKFHRIDVPAVVEKLLEDGSVFVVNSVVEGLVSDAGSLGEKQPGDFGMTSPRSVAKRRIEFILRWPQLGTE